jgi:hypothetical protein
MNVDLPAHEHRTDPLPEPIRPGRYRHTATGLETVVRSVGPDGWLCHDYAGLCRLWESSAHFRPDFARIPDQEPTGGPG